MPRTHFRPRSVPFPGTHAGTSRCLSSHLLEHCLSSKNVPLRAHICTYSLSRRLSSSQIKWALPALWERAGSHPETSDHWSLSHPEENPASQECALSPHVQLCPTFCNPMDCSPLFLCPWDSPGKSTGVGYRVLLQGIFPIQGSNLSLQRLLHYSCILHH